MKEKESGRRSDKKLALATMKEREVLKVAAEFLRPINQGVINIGSATTFRDFVEGTYLPVVISGMAKSTRDRYRGVLKNYLLPAFGDLCLRDITLLNVDRYFVELGRTTTLQHESLDKIRDVLSSALGSAVRYGSLTTNPAAHVRLPRRKRGLQAKPWITRMQFQSLIQHIPEPYATMVYVATFTGLRVSELIGLRWNDVLEDSIIIDERCCRGDWGAPKSDASNATIPVHRSVIERIQILKTLTVEVRAGRSTRHYQVVKSDGPNDLVFQSVATGAAMRDNNILRRHLKPAARAVGLGFVNWRCLRTSFATWLKEDKADIKDAQKLMRHSRASTTSDIYQQFILESERAVVDGLVH